MVLCERVSEIKQREKNYGSVALAIEENMVRDVRNISIEATVQN